MNHSPRCRQLIILCEGREHEAYPDPATKADPWTIGVGHTGPEIHRGLVWSDAQIDAALDVDLVKFDKGVTALLGTAPTTQNQFDALVSFAFNVGIGNLASSTLLRLHRAGLYDGARAQFGLWNKAGGRVMAGLTKRRAAEAALYGSA